MNTLPIGGVARKVSLKVGRHIMTKPNEWENADWDQAAQETFWKKYRRSRNRKLEMLVAKARLLFGSGEAARKQVACDLLEDVLTAYQENRDGIRDKQKFPKSFKDGVLNCVRNLADLCDADGCIGGAERALESFWIVYFDDYAPAISRSDFLLRPPGLLMDAGRFDEARERLNTFQQKMLIHDSNVSPYLQLRFGYAWARYGDLTGDYSRCDETFLELRQRSRGDAFCSYVDLEQMPVFNVHGDVETDPRSASESIITYHHADIPTVFEKSRQSLVDLDLHLGLNAPNGSVSQTFPSQLCLHRF